MSLTDLASGYWQIPLYEDSRKYTAFLFESKLYHFRRIPFGIKTAGSPFIRSLNFAIGNQFDDCLTTYIDDFFISTSGSVENNIDKMCYIFETLQKLFPPLFFFFITLVYPHRHHFKNFTMTPWEGVGAVCY